MAVEMELLHRNYCSALDSRRARRLSEWTDRFYGLIQYDHRKSLESGDTWSKEWFFHRISLDTGVRVLPREEWSRTIDYYFELEGEQLSAQIRPAMTAVVDPVAPKSDASDLNPGTQIAVQKATGGTPPDGLTEWQPDVTGRIIWSARAEVLEILYRSLQKRLDCTVERFYALFADELGEPITPPSALRQSAQNQTKAKAPDRAYYSFEGFQADVSSSIEAGPGVAKQAIQELESESRKVAVRFGM